MDWKQAQEIMRSRPWESRAAKLRQGQFPAGYAKWRPERAKEIDGIRQRLAEEAHLISLDVRLTDQGREAQFTEREAKGALRELQKIAKDIGRKKAAIAKRREELLAARRPQAPDLHATLELGIALLLTAGDEGRRAALMNSMLEVPEGGRASRLQEAFLAIPAVAIGPAGEAQQHLLRSHFGIKSLGTEGQELDTEDRFLDIEENAVRDLQVAVAHVSDPEELVNTGFIEKPFAMMTGDERVAYTKEHGVDALSRLAYGDVALFGEFVTVIDEPEPDGAAKNAAPAPANTNPATPASPKPPQPATV